MMKRKIAFPLVCASLLLAGGALPAVAQTVATSPQDTVVSQQSIAPTGQGVAVIGETISPIVQTGEPLTGIHLGAFMVNPTLVALGQYNTNVFAVSSDAKSDWSAEIHPGLAANTTWRHYEVSFDAEYARHVFDQYSQLDTTNYLFSGDVKGDVGDGQFQLRSEYDRLDEEPGNTNLATNAAAPTTYFRWNNTADFVQTFSLFQLGFGGYYTTFRFDNTPAIGGGIIDEELRDRNIAGGYVDLGHQLTNDYSVFIRGEYSSRDYTYSASSFRSSTGYELTGGVRGQLTHLITGQAYLGYMERDYNGLPTVGGLDYGIQLDWSATPLTHVILNSGRTIQETDQTGATAFYEADTNLTITHSLSRRTSLNAQAAYTNDDYIGVNRVENIYSLTAGVDYLISDHVLIGADYRYDTRQSNLAQSSYNQNLVELRLRLLP